MARIVIFDSGLGSLSVIREIQAAGKSEIVYFGDQANFPYGNKTKPQLEKIIKKTVRKLKENFSPDLIVVGSNTPTVMLDIKERDVIGVRPPITDAKRITKTKNIGILGTESAIKSRGLHKYIKSLNIGSDIRIYKINGSPLVELVESGKFLTNKNLCKKIIKKTLEDTIMENNIDVMTLSSTHLPFLRSLMEIEFPNITFIDPAESIAKRIHKKIRHDSKKNYLKIFCSGDIKNFQINLRKLGITNKVRLLRI